MHKQASLNLSNNYRLVMMLLISIFYLNLHAQSPLGKIIDFEVEKTPIAEALIELSEAADINIAFHPRLFNKAETVSGVFQQKSVGFILKKCLEKTRITYKLEGTHLILYQKPPTLYTISGYIQDAKTGERLVGATIWEANAGKGGITNDYGFFSLKVPEGNVLLQCSYIGYQPLTKKTKLNKNQKIQLDLSPSITLTEVIVTANNLDQNEAHLTLGKGEAINLQNLSAGISLGGESDLMGFIRGKVGVQSGADGIGGMSVRGGGVDQNLILMDGVPIYNPSHSLGLFSVFNTHIIKSASMLTGGFSAKYGGRLSSVLDVRVKEGNTKEWKGTAEIGTLASKLTVEGPIQKDKSGLLISMRRTHIDPLLNYISSKEKEKEFEEGSVNYFFFDLNAKFHHRLSAKDQLFFSFYKGKDDFGDNSIYEYDVPEYDEYYLEESNQEIDWGNEIAALRWNHLFGEQLFSNTTFTLSRYNYNSLNIYNYLEDTPDSFEAQYSYDTFQSKISDAGLKIDFEYYPAPQHQVLFGGGLLFRSFESGIIDQIIDDIDNLEDFEDAPFLVDETFAPPIFKAQEVNFYIEDKITIDNQLFILAGLHVATFFTNNTTNYIIPQPRLHLKWQPKTSLTTTLSIGKMSQFLHILSDTGGGLPNDLWVPSTSNVRPQTAWQIAWSSNYTFQKDWSIQLGAYFKKMNHLVTLLELPTVPGLIQNDPTFWEEEITKGTGKSYGFSTNLEKKTGKTTGTINYAYTISTRQFEDNNEGESYPFRFTHPHEVKINLKHQITPSLAAFASWQYGSGQPYSLVSTTYRFSPLSNSSNGDEERIGTINSSRLPAYHRLDAGIHYQWAGAKTKQFLNLGVYNLYNRKNPYYQYLLEGSFFEDDDGLKQQNALPILPSIAYRVVF